MASRKISPSPRPAAGWERKTKSIGDPGQDPRSNMNTDRGNVPGGGNTSGRSQPQSGAAAGSIPGRSR